MKEKAPLLLPAAGMVAGSAVAYAFRVDLFPLLGAWCAVLGVLVLRRKRVRGYLQPVLVFAAGALSAMIMASLYRVPQPRTTDSIWKFTGRVTEMRTLTADRSASGDPIRFTVKLETVNRSPRMRNARVRCIVGRPGTLGERLFPGDRIRAVGTFSRIDPPDVPGVFDYSAYLKRSRLSGVVYIPTKDGVLDHVPGSFLNNPIIHQLCW